MKKQHTVIIIGHIHHNEKLLNSGPNMCITSFLTIQAVEGIKMIHFRRVRLKPVVYNHVRLRKKVDVLISVWYHNFSDS